jgi:aspartate/methionine/tyrosine aminotransferase
MMGDWAFDMAGFLTQWAGHARFDLSASESETMAVSALLALSGEQDRQRWDGLELGYADPHGAPWLRTTIAERYPGLEMADVLCCAGAQEGLMCVARALLAPGDHVVVLVPVYQPSERTMTSVCGASGVALRAENGWQPDLRQVTAAIRPNTRLMLVNFPNSPTGAAIDPAVLDALVALCRRHGLWLVNDEVYRSAQANPAPPVGAIYERGVSIDAVSKGFGLPGLRVGWVACRDRAMLARALLVKSALSSCLAAPSEVLAHIALRAEGAILGRNRAIGQRNRARLAALLQRHAGMLEGVVERDALLAFPRYLGADGALRFAERAAAEAGVLMLPSILWRSALADVPVDRLRIGLGRQQAGPALDALDAYLAGCSAYTRGAVAGAV